VAGPLVTRQTLVLPDGTDAPGEPDLYYWAYHHAVGISVDGTIKVLDLSTGDEPRDIQAWLSGFVEAGTPCYHLSDDEHQEVWVYWNSVFGNFEPPPQPARLCGYTFTPLFTFRRDQKPADLAEFIGFVPSTMVTQLEGMKTVLRTKGVPDMAEDLLPGILSRYQAGTIDEVCSRVPSLAVCPGGGSGGGGLLGD
jgi:hypothetical protein